MLETDRQCFHKRRIVHRDIAARNVLVTRMVDGSIEVKLADFGRESIKYDQIPRYPPPIVTDGDVLLTIRYVHAQFHDGSRLVTPMTEASAQMRCLFDGLRLKL